jgi:hypothetical protein
MATLEHETVDQRVTQLMEEGPPATDAFLNSYPHQMSGGQQQRRNRHGISCRRVDRLDEPTRASTSPHNGEFWRPCGRRREHQVTRCTSPPGGRRTARRPDRGALRRSPRDTPSPKPSFAARVTCTPLAFSLSQPRPQRDPGRHRRQATTARALAPRLFLRRTVWIRPGRVPPRTTGDRDLGDIQPHWVRCPFPEPPVSVDQAKRPSQCFARCDRCGSQPCRLLWPPRFRNVCFDVKPAGVQPSLDNPVLARRHWPARRRTAHRLDGRRRIIRYQAQS